MAGEISPTQRIGGFEAQSDTLNAIANATISPVQSSRVEEKTDKPFIQVMREVGLEKDGQGTIAFATKFGNIGGQQVNYLNTDGISKDLGQQPFVRIDIDDVNKRNPVSRQLQPNYVDTKVTGNVKIDASVGANVKTEA